ncbi:MAG TPA: hypothetical protein VFF06_36370 [Polyangia bacterium]|nr:hypothetical protein [Polyangia bacterium]
MMRNWVMATVLVFGAVGCGGEPADDSVDTIDDVTKADASYPSGVYENAKPQIGDFYLLELNADKTFLHKTQGVDCIPNFGTCGQMTGSYKFSHSGSTKYIRFYDDAGNYVDRYAYTLSGDKLSLKASGSHTFVMTKSALSGKGDSCGGFTRAPKQCAPGLICIFKNVPDVPGTCQPANPCQEAGGDCVALAPHSCNGQVQDARQFSCGGGLGVECCFSN